MSNDRDKREGEGDATQAANVASAALDTVRAVGEGDAGEAISGASEVVGGVAGAVGGEAARAVHDAAAAAHTGVGAAQSLASAARGASDPTRRVLSGREATEALQRSRMPSEARGLTDDFGLETSSNQDVAYHLEVEGLDARFGVRRVSIKEKLSGLYNAVVEALCADAHPDVTDLLRKDCTLSMERPTQRRSLKGIVSHAVVHDTVDGVSVELHIVPALWLFRHNRESRIYQNLSIPQIVEQLHGEILGSLQRTLQNDLQETYPTYEYVVQYRESHLHFIKRLLELEGIFFYFDHDGDKETLVLADSNASRPSVRSEDGGRVPFAEIADQAPDHEAVTHVQHRQHLGASEVVLGDYNWTTPSVEIRSPHAGRNDGDPSIEVFDHADAIRFFDYDEGAGQYRDQTGARIARSRAQLLDQLRDQWRMQGTVVTAQPGHLLEVTGCPDGALDGRYLIVACHTSGSATAGARGALSNTLECVPVDRPFRPPLHTPRPIVPGPETAIVVGPAGEEIHTDKHGRVKVQFHWDRYGARDEHSSCWMRVAHNWAGPGFGTFFVPRIGMEVIVSFLGGDPDQPLVTSCVYNGSNHVNVDLPAKKTQSLIRTKSSLNSEGFNEIRFEDEAGNEFIYVHAQKDLNEKVLNNHSTTVHANQTNTVHGKQTETVHKDQEMTVKKNRTKTVDLDETVYINGNRTETVHLTETLILEDCRQTTITLDEDLTIERDRIVRVQGTETEHIQGAREVVVHANDSHYVQDGGNLTTQVSGEMRTKVDQKFQLVQGGSEKQVLDANQTYIESGGQVHIVTGPVHVKMNKDGGDILMTMPTKFTVNVGDSKFEMTPSSIAMESPEIQLKAGDSLLKLAAAAAQLKGAMVDVLADMFTTIKGTLVRIN